MNYASLFSSFSDDARLWIYAADRSLSDEEQHALRAALDDFFAGWASHGRTVHGAAEFVADRFLLIAATLEEGDISGCGIDASVGTIEDLGQQLGLTWLSSLDVCYRDAQGRVHHATRAGFRELVERGAVTSQTPIFDLSLRTVGALHAGRFEQPAGRSWPARAFDLASAPAA